MTHPSSPWIPHSPREIPSLRSHRGRLCWNLSLLTLGLGSSPCKQSTGEIPLTQNTHTGGGGGFAPSPAHRCVLQPQNQQLGLMQRGWSSPGDVESLPAAVPVARHARSRGCLALPALLLADVAGLQEKGKSDLSERRTALLPLLSRRQSPQRLRSHIIPLL